MSDAVWYYVDKQQQRNGPVTAAAVAEAYGFGWVDDNSLVWREGLGAWSPLAGHRAELGLVGPPSAPPLARPAYPTAPRKSSMSGCLIVGIVAAALAIPVMAILAAIALPAYQDYIARSQAAAGLVEIRAYVSEVDRFVVNNGRCPTDGSEVGLATTGQTSPRLSGIVIGEDTGGQCQIAGTLIGNPAVHGATIRLVRDGPGNWSCQTTISRPLHEPPGCRRE